MCDCKTYPWSDPCSWYREEDDGECELRVADEDTGSDAVRGAVSVGCAM
jgi:hypothetical protein